jgi:hypothetical protein
MMWFCVCGWLGLCVLIYIPWLFSPIYLTFMFSFLQCFDFDNFIKINLKRPSWRCPHCNQPVCYTEIRLDRNMIEASWFCSSIFQWNYLLFIFFLLESVCYQLTIGNVWFSNLFFMPISYSLRPYSLVLLGLNIHIKK